MSTSDKHESDRYLGNPKKVAVPVEPEIRTLHDSARSQMYECNLDPTVADVHQTDDLRPDRRGSTTHLPSQPLQPLERPNKQNDMPRLSQELLDMSVDFVRDRRDLLACCQASSLLLPRSRSHLFRRLRLKPLTKINRYETVYTPECLLPYVREVEILGCLTPNAYPGDDANSGLNDEGDPDHTWMNAIIPLLRTLDSSQVEWLDLRDLSWGDIASGTREFLLSHFVQARRLTLSAIDFWNSNQMFRTLNAFPNIHGLSMENLSWHRANHARKQLESTANLHLRYLHIGQTEFARYGPFVKWLLGQRGTVTVDEAFVVWEDTEISSLITLLRRLAPSLKGLVYQQCMVMPGSEVVDARLEAAAAAAANHAPAVAAPAQAPATVPAPGVNNADAVPHEETPQPATVDHEPHAAADGDEGDAEVEADDNNSEGGEDLLDDGDEGDPRGGPPIEMDDDVPEDESLVEQFVSENLTFPREKEALRDGMDMLNALPITDSRVERLNARIAWSSLAVFGIKLMSQIFTKHTKTFGLLLVLPPMAQWDGIDWLSIDSLLDDVAQRASKDSVLELSCLGAFARRQEDLPSIRAFLSTKLPLLLARKRWNAKYDNINLG